MPNACSPDTATHDIDPDETQEWRDALSDVIDHYDAHRAAFLIQSLQQAYALPIDSAAFLKTDYINTLKSDLPLDYPGDRALEEKIINAIRWNAVMMVSRAVKKDSALGGHLSTYASAAILYEIGFHHFFKGDDAVYFQGHASPGIYARAFLEGRLSEDQLNRFRQEVEGGGLSSYPHPWLMPDFWQFPTVSMGLGPLQAIYQARFLKYLHNRKLAQTDQRKVWAFLGDAEMDEVESLGALPLASREQLNNLIFVINCNLQGLDGPVRGNGKIIQELESVFKGAGWDVIKIVWDSQWDTLLKQDTQNILKKRMKEVLDGDYQTYYAKGPAYFREHFFNTPALKALVHSLSDEQLFSFKRGGLDPLKVYQAYSYAVNNHKPTVILAKTVKGHGLGVEQGEGMNIAHNLKKLNTEALKKLRDTLNIPLSDTEVEHLNFYRPDKKSPEIHYLKKQRERLGGYLPARRTCASQPLDTASAFSEKDFAPLFEGTGEREISTTMAFVRILNHLMKHKTLGPRIVPIIPDECRTFGMEGMFRSYGIYSPHGQQYTPADKEQVMYYKQSTEGQLLQEGINEAGAFCSWIAAGTSYSVSDVPMIPFYIFYSMFGFQRTGDLAWAAADARTSGFLIGGTAGRTTLAGEGLQHQDGHQLLLAATIPNCIAYDPTYAYEMAVIIQEGLKRMYQNQESVYYYITAMNENYTHPSFPKDADIATVKQGIIKGLYRLQKSELSQNSPSNALKNTKNTAKKIVLLGSGCILREALAAAHMLEENYGIAVDIFSATSFNELRREALSVERWNFLHPDSPPQTAYITHLLKDYSCPVIAVTDYMRSYPDQIRAFLPSSLASYTVLGTDGFGRSDTREQLRHFFEVNRFYITLASLKAVADTGAIPKETLIKAFKTYKINAEKPAPFCH